MNRLKFLSPEGHEIEPHVWLDCWAARYRSDDNREYFRLIEKQGKLLREDFEQVGKWKEGCLEPPNHGSWKQEHLKPTMCGCWRRTSCLIAREKIALRTS